MTLLNQEQERERERENLPEEIASTFLDPPSNCYQILFVASPRGAKQGLLFGRLRCKDAKPFCLEMDFGDLYAVRSCMYTCLTIADMMYYVSVHCAGTNVTRTFGMLTFIAAHCSWFMGDKVDYKDT